MYAFLTLWLRLKNDRRAVTALEYGLIASAHRGRHHHGGDYGRNRNENGIHHDWHRPETIVPLARAASSRSPARPAVHGGFR